MFGKAKRTEIEALKYVCVLMHFTSAVSCFILSVWANLEFYNRVNSDIGSYMGGVAEEPDKCFSSILALKLADMSYTGFDHLTSIDVMHHVCPFGRIVITNGEIGVIWTYGAKFTKFEVFKNGSDCIYSEAR